MLSEEIKEIFLYKIVPACGLHGVNVC